MDKKSYHHNNLKNELIEKGIELVSNYGLSQLSLRKVAQSCNVSHAAPYSHFANKEELVAAMQLHITEQSVAKSLATLFPGLTSMYSLTPSMHCGCGRRSTLSAYVYTIYFDTVRTARAELLPRSVSWGAISSLGQIPFHN